MLFCGAKARVFLMGTVFVLQHQSSVDAELKSISHDLVNSDLVVLPLEKKPEACQKDVRGEAILIGGIIFRIKENHVCYRDIFRSSISLDTFLKQTVARECNGKNRCVLSYSIKLGIQVVCDGHPLPANEIVIYYECKPIKPDHQQVFNMAPGLSVNITSRAFKTSYLVLELRQARPTTIHCEIKGNNQELKFTLLHVDFGPNLNCNAPIACHGHINITDDKMKTIHFTYNWLPNDTFNEYLKFVTFDVSMSTGLLWIQLEGYAQIDVECNGTQDELTTTEIPDKTELRTSEVTTMAGHGPTRNATRIEVSGTTEGTDGTTVDVDGTTIEVAGKTIGVEGTKVGVDVTTVDVNDTTIEVDVTTVGVYATLLITDTDDQFDLGSGNAQGVQLEIVTPVAVAGLLALLVVVLCVVCACSANSPLRQWKRSKRCELRQEIRCPLHNEYDYATTNEFLDCTSGCALTAQTNKCAGKDEHAGDNDYMEVTSYEETPLVTTPTSTTALHPRTGSQPGAPLTPAGPDTPTPTKWALARSAGLNGPVGPVEAVESTYSMAEDDGEPFSEPSVLYSAVKASSPGEIEEAKSPGEEAEYSRLNDVTNRRNVENVYNG